MYLTSILYEALLYTIDRLSRLMPVRLLQMNRLNDRLPDDVRDVLAGVEG